MDRLSIKQALLLCRGRLERSRLEANVLADQFGQVGEEALQRHNMGRSIAYAVAVASLEDILDECFPGDWSPYESPIHEQCTGEDTGEDTTP